MTETYIKQFLTQINWDSPLRVDELYQIFAGQKDSPGGFDKTWIYSRLPNTFN